ncbi:MAG: hypothetical protein GX945_12490 [Lentisphaerae bacterium]|nr:hypothetical protein [Lentisphaerota bacterium]
MNLNEKLQRLPERHRTLLALLFLLLVLGVIYGMFFLRPQWNVYSELLSEYASVDKKLSESPWPKDSARLKSLLQTYEQNLRGMKKSSKAEEAAASDIFTADPRDLGLQDKAELVMKHATGMFNQKIDNAYGDVSNFVTKASQTEYKDLYDRTDSMLQGMKVVLEPSIFGMDESTAEPEKYQMILKLWTVQEVVRRARENKLRVATDPSLIRAGLGRPSKVSVLPMIPYCLDPQDKEPYLLEFPVRLEVEGSLDNFIKFVQSLQSENCFLPMKQMELLAEQPPQAQQIQVEPDGTVNRVFKTPRGEVKRPTGTNGVLKMDNISAVVVCSSFFRPAPGTPVRSTRRQVIEPKPMGI